MGARHVRAHRRGRVLRKRIVDVRIERPINPLMDVEDGRPRVGNVLWLDETRVWIAHLVVALSPVRRRVERLTRREEQLEAKLHRAAREHRARAAVSTQSGLPINAHAAAPSIVPPLGEISLTHQVLRRFKRARLPHEPHPHARAHIAEPRHVVAEPCSPVPREGRVVVQRSRRFAETHQVARDLGIEIDEQLALRQRHRRAVGAWRGERERDERLRVEPPLAVDVEREHIPRRAGEHARV